jgi:hypothetical protein
MHSQKEAKCSSIGMFKEGKVPLYSCMLILALSHAGISRSTTFVCAYMMEFKKMSLKSVLVDIQQVRPFIQPNGGFMRQLDTHQASLGLDSPPPLNGDHPKADLS